MTRMNNPVLQMLNILRSGGNPVALAQQLAGSDPRMRQFVSMVQGKSPDQLRQMAENMAHERGVSVNDVAQQLGITVPSGR